MKKPGARPTFPWMAERVGFEPTDPCGSTVFKTAAFGHSATSPDRDVGQPGKDTGTLDAFSSIMA
jgi:hypothetical protein